MANFSYNRGPCPRCGKDLSSAGFARAAHNRMHARRDRDAMATRFQDGTAYGDDIDSLPWKQALDYLWWRGYDATNPAYPQLQQKT